MSATIDHNPGCGTSRGALAAIRASGVEPEVIESLHTPASRERLTELHAAAGLTARGGMRVQGNDALIETLGLTHPDPDPERDAERVWDAMTAHPILIGRALVVGPRGTVLARSSERALEAPADSGLGPAAEEDDAAVGSAGPAMGGGAS